MKDESVIPEALLHRKVKYLNNRLESDHGKLKRLIKPTLDFKSMKTAYAIIKGFEIMRMIRKGQFDRWMCGEAGPKAEAKFINRIFNLKA